MSEITVVIPLLNGEKHFTACLDSIPRDLDLDILVVDDGSTDGGVEIARGMGARIVSTSTPRSGASAARNLGWKMSDSPLVAFLDADDWWSLGSLEARRKALLGDANLQVVQGRIQTHAEGDVDPRIRHRHRSDPYYGVNLGASLYRREALERLQGFDENLRYNEDADFFVRLWEEGIAKRFLPEVCLFYRLHEANGSSDAPHDRLVPLMLMKQHKERMKGRDFHPPCPMADYMGWTRP